VPIVIIPVNQGPVDTGIRVPVQRIAVDELNRQLDAERKARQEAERRTRQEAEVQARSTPANVALDPPLPTNVSVLQAMIAELRQVVTSQGQLVAELQQAINELLQRSQRTPRDTWSPNQPALFPDAHPDAAGSSTEPTGPTETLASPCEDAATEPKGDSSHPKKKKKGHGRRSLEELLKTLPCDRREHTLTEAERVCPCCGGTRRKIGEQVTHQLEYIPAKLVCVEHAQFTYSCPHCPEHIETAPKPPQPIDRGLAGPGLLALVAASKFDDYLPLYRQELILSRAGLFLARSTLCDWLIAMGELVEPLVEHMKRDLFQSRVVQTDGTSIDVLIEGQRETTTGYFWPCLGDEQHPQVVVDFSLDKCKEHPQTFLADYSGYVHVDAYSAYNGCFISDLDNPKSEVGCWSHTERYFESAQTTDPTRAAEALAYIRALFAIEMRAKRDHLAESEVLALRQRESVTILDDFHKWLGQTRDQVLPKSPLADAIRYTLNQWEALRRYTEAGFLSIDNNATERINKLIARGRVNWLFVGSPRGGVTAARLLSLVVTCRRLHMDSFQYLRDVFTRLPSLPANRLDELLPNRWLQAHSEARHPPQRQGHGHGDPSPRRPHRSRRGK
jgi:transposase